MWPCGNTSEVWMFMKIKTDKTFLLHRQSENLMTLTLIGAVTNRLWCIRDTLNKAKMRWISKTLNRSQSSECLAMSTARMQGGVPKSSCSLGVNWSQEMMNEVKTAYVERHPQARKGLSDTTISSWFKNNFRMILLSKSTWMRRTTRIQIMVWVMPRNSLRHIQTLIIKGCTSRSKACRHSRYHLIKNNSERKCCPKWDYMSRFSCDKEMTESVSTWILMKPNSQTTPEILMPHRKTRTREGSRWSCRTIE